MKLQEIFDQLEYGELSQLSIGGLPAGVIDESNWPRLVAHINLGMIALYKRFTLKQGRITLALVSGQTRYRLHSDYSVHSLRVPLETKYIMDSVTARFADDIQKVERITGDHRLGMINGVAATIGAQDRYLHERAEFGLNDLSDEFAIFTPSRDVIEVPRAIVNHGWDLPERWQTDNLEIFYRADAPKIVIPIGYFDPDRVEVPVPASHLEPLLYFVAGRIHNPVGMGDEFNAGNTYAAKFEAACQQLESAGLQVNQDSQGSNRLARNGWV